MCSPTIAGNDLGLTDKNHSCACASDEGHASVGSHASDASITEQYLVDGMTCSHCAASVTEEIAALDGVESVSVDLKAGGASRVTVMSSKPVEAEAIRAAVAEAGYSLATA